MASLIESLETLRLYVETSPHIDFEKVLPFKKRAERKYIKKLIGGAQLEALIAYQGAGEDNLSKVKDLLTEALACYTIVSYLTPGSTSVTGAGILKNNNDDSSQAEWYEIRDLKREYFFAANEAIDEALELMEKNTSDFQAWTESDNYTLFNDCVVKKTGDFNSGFFINNNRLVFLALKPYMKEVEEQYLIPLLGNCYSEIINTSTDPIKKRAQELARNAVIALTVSKVCTAGTFLFTSSGMSILYEELPWEKKKSLSEFQLDNLMEDRQNSGEEYLKKLKKVIVDNPTVFPCFQQKTTVGLDNRIIKKKSGLSI
ncbi:DUF6712 family protein [Flavobacterium beibuense]|uniref:DUF6712 family protein n=1 Tax=Flavobacterium beibuense TaxID=657326 RepID=UPI003A8E0ED8